jgi:hypothetical protein
MAGTAKVFRLHHQEDRQMNVRRRPASVFYSVITGLVLVSAASARVLAQGDHASHRGADATDAKGALVQAVRDATERFRDVSVAQAEGYALQFGCVSGSDVGAMGMHFVNFPLVGDSEIDVTHPEIVIYEPKPDGSLKLIGADFLVLKDVWDAKHPAPPQLMGQLFHLFEAPNRFGLPAFYTLHVWAWKDNPNGSFVNWHPNVKCDGFAGGGLP